MLGSRSKKEYNASERQIKFSSFGRKPRPQFVYTVFYFMIYYFYNPLSIYIYILIIKLDQFKRYIYIYIIVKKKVFERFQKTVYRNVALRHFIIDHSIRIYHYINHSLIQTIFCIYRHWILFSIILYIEQRMKCVSSTKNAFIVLIVMS